VTSVLVSVPNAGWIHKMVTFSLLRLMKDRRHKVRIILPTNSPFENNLHHIVRDFLKGAFDFWLSIDADNPPMKNPLDLIDHDLDIVGCPTPVWHCDFKTQRPRERPYYWNAYDYVEEEDAYREHREKSGLQPVDAIGTGCFLVARRVFEHEGMKGGAFTRSLHPDGRVNKGNDIRFCERAREAGFKVWAHYDYPCMHLKEVELTEIIRGFDNLYNA